MFFHKDHILAGAQGLDARFAPAPSGFTAVSNGVQVAAAAGIRFNAVPAKRGRIARYCAMLVMYVVVGACETAGVAGIRVKQRVLKPRNVWICDSWGMFATWQRVGNTAYISPFRHSYQQELGGVRVDQRARKAWNV